FPMHLAGLAGEPRHYAQLAGPVESFAKLIPVERGITSSALLLATVQLVFLFNFFWSARAKVAPSGANPWQATTLEWSGEEHLMISNGPYSYGPVAGADEDFRTQ